MNSPEQQREYPQEQWQERLRQRIRPEELPIGQKKEEIGELLDESFASEKKTALIQGETGSGKSVLLPGILREKLIEQGLPLKTLVIQPRRDAAMSVSRAISAVEEFSWGEKGKVGCSTSEAKEINADTEIPVVTTGIALRYLSQEIQKSRSDNYTPEFGAVIVDEFHENSIEYHLILGMLRMLQREGKAPFVLLTSATLDKKKTQKFFNITDREYLKVEGRTYPVNIKFASESHSGDSENKDYIQETVKQTEALLKETRGGDILVFMPGVREINAVIRNLENLNNVEVLSLHGSLKLDERDYVINSEPKPYTRRVIVSTNIAETSLTLPRIVGVVDSCRRRSVKYNPETGIYERKTDLISHDSAEQRAGRAGRVRSGVCRRLVTRDEWDDMPENIVPEIYQANLSHVVLKLRGLDIDPADFPFIDPPEKEDLRQAENQLTLLGALDENGKLTPVGRRMLDMPFFEPSIARMVVEAEKRDCLVPALIMAVLERESNIFASPSQREISNKQLDILEERGYYTESAQPLRLTLEGVEVSNEDAKYLFDSVKQDARIRMGDIYRDTHRQFGDGSDWERNLNVFLDSLDEGVIEAARNERTPEGHRIREQFTDRCREFYLNERALMHAASHVFDYARMLDVDIDVETLADILESADWEKLSLVILAGHPHMLLYQLEAGRMPTYAFFQNGGGKYVNISPGSSAFQTRPVCCIVTKIHEGKGTVSGMEVKRNYAAGVHPIEPEQILEVFPHLIEKRDEGMRQTWDGQVVNRTIITPKGVWAALKEIEEPVSLEQAEAFLAERMMEPRVESYDRSDYFPSRDYGFRPEVRRTLPPLGDILENTLQPEEEADAEEPAESEDKLTQPQSESEIPQELSEIIARNEEETQGSALAEALRKVSAAYKKGENREEK